MENFYKMVIFIYENITGLINNVVVFMTTDIGESIAANLSKNEISESILNALFDITDLLGIYHMTPLEVMLGIGLPVCLLWTLIKWILPTS